MNKIKQFLRWIRDAGHFYVMVVPLRSSSGSRSHKLSPLQVVIFIVLYTGIVGFLSFMFLRVTPVDNLMFSDSSKLSNNEKIMIAELDQKLKLLSAELYNLKRYNAKLKDAVKLADSTLILDSGNSKKSKISKKINTGGNIFAVFKELFSGIITGDDSSVLFRKPVNGFISRDFYPEKGHTGLDFIVKTGTPVYASANGYVLFADYTIEDGYQVILSHPGNYITIYKHCSYILKKEKDRIVQGELIALSGNTGEVTTGPHLHFEIWLDGRPVDPKNLLIDY